MFSNHPEDMAIYDIPWNMAALETKCGITTNSYCYVIVDYGDVSALVGHWCEFAVTLMGSWTFWSIFTRLKHW